MLKHFATKFTWNLIENKSEEKHKNKTLLGVKQDVSFHLKLTARPFPQTRHRGLSNNSTQTYYIFIDPLASSLLYCAGSS